MPPIIGRNARIFIDGVELFGAKFRQETGGMLELAAEPMMLKYGVVPECAWPYRSPLYEMAERIRTRINKRRSKRLRRARGRRKQ